MSKKFYGNTEFKGKIKLAETASRLPVIDSNGEVTSSAVTRVSN